MQLVESSKGLKVAKVLADTEVRALREWYAGEPHDGNALGRILRLAWEKHWWFRCHCREGSAGGPLLHVRRTKDNTLTVVRMPRRDPHDPQCPFSNDSDAAFEIGGHGASTGVPSLGMLFYRLVTGAGLNEIWDVASDEWALPEQYNRLRQTMSGNMGGAAPPFKTFGTHVDALPSMGTHLASLERDWPGTSDPWGVLMLVGDDINEKKIVGQGKNISVYGKITRTRGAAEQTRPWLVTARVSRTSQSRYGVVDAYAHPIYKRNLLIPIGASKERDTLRVLLELQRWWRKKIDTRVVIEKQCSLRGDEHDGFLLRRVSGAGVTERQIGVYSKLPNEPGVEEHEQEEAYHLVGAGRTLDRKFGQITTARLFG